MCLRISMELFFSKKDTTIGMILKNMCFIVCVLI